MVVTIINRIGEILTSKIVCLFLSILACGVGGAGIGYNIALSQRLAEVESYKDDVYRYGTWFEYVDTQQRMLWKDVNGIRNKSDIITLLCIQVRALQVEQEKLKNEIKTSGH